MMINVRLMMINVYVNKKKITKIKVIGF